MLSSGLRKVISFCLRPPGSRPMQTQLLRLCNLVHVAQGWDVEMVLVDGEIVVEDARLLKTASQRRRS